MLVQSGAVALESPEFLQLELVANQDPGGERDLDVWGTVASV